MSTASHQGRSYPLSCQNCDYHQGSKTRWYQAVVQICSSILILFIYIWTWSSWKVHVPTWSPHGQENWKYHQDTGPFLLQINKEAQMRLTTHCSSARGKTNAYTNSFQAMSQGTLGHHRELKGAKGYSKFSRGTAILDICQTMKELVAPHSSQFQHYIPLYTAFNYIISKSLRS